MESNITIPFLFDNDGVLIDSSALHWQSWQLFMDEEIELAMTHQEFLDSFGKRNDLILKELVPHVSEEKAQNWAERKEEIFRNRAQNAIQLLPGMEFFLQKIVSHHHPHIIASSAPIANLKMFLSHTVLGKYFDQFVSAEQVPHGKPFPDVFIAAAHKLGFQPEDCIVIEDAPSGITAGKRAGCFVVALGTTHSKDHLLENADKYDLFFNSPKDLDLSMIISSFKER